jgi:glyoxylase-like metal-dependent hydrolase (beta-lactamase superfamily II)
VDVVHTPGHTPEHVCLLVTDRTRSDEAWFVLTGHTLMVGDVGRTELAEDAAYPASLPILGDAKRRWSWGGWSACQCRS